MERLTTNKETTELGMYELAHNCCYVKDKLARYRDFETDIDARDLARKLMKSFAGEELSSDNDTFDVGIMEYLIYDATSDPRGLIALFYRNLCAMADLREHLRTYEDAEENGMLIHLPCRVGDTVWYMDSDDDSYPIELCVTKIEIFKNDIFYRAVTTDDGTPAVFSNDDIGKTVFLTRESAEAVQKGEK